MADEEQQELDQQQEVEQQEEQPVLFYARALYSYQAVEEGEFDFNESGMRLQITTMNAQNISIIINNILYIVLHIFKHTF